MHRVHTVISFLFSVFILFYLFFFGAAGILKSVVGRSAFFSPLACLRIKHIYTHTRVYLLFIIVVSCCFRYFWTNNTALA